VLGVQAEYFVRLDETQAEADNGEYWEAWQALWEQYEADEIAPSPAAQLAGKRLVELTVDDLGLLAGRVQENEGLALQDRESATEEEADP
jgi:hypothetical protein